MLKVDGPSVERQAKLEQSLIPEWVTSGFGCLRGGLRRILPASVVECCCTQTPYKSRCIPIGGMIVDNRISRRHDVLEA